MKKAITKKKNLHLIPPKVKAQTPTKQESRVLEKIVEDYLCLRVKELGLTQRKLNPNTCKGIPDRLVWHPDGLGQVTFVEVKRDWKARASKLQLELAKGLKTIFIYSKSDVETFLWQYYTTHYRRPARPVEED